MDYEVHVYIFISLILAYLSGSEATEYCYSRYCSNRCCGDFFNHYCCSTSLSTGDIVGIVFGCCIVGAIIICVVCAIKKSKGSQGRVLPQAAVIHTTGQPRMQPHPQYPPPYYAHTTPGQQSAAYPPPAAMYNQPQPHGNQPPPGFQPNSNPPPPPGFQPQPLTNQAGTPQGQPTPAQPPPAGFIATPQGGTSGVAQGQQANPFAQAAQKSS